MKITWIGHSCFKIEEDGYTLIIDPYKDDYIPGLAPVREKANQVLKSHDHDDHNATDNIEIVKGKASPFKISTIETYHDGNNGAERGKNLIHIIETKTQRVAHLGDLGCELTDEQMGQLYQVDALLIPVGGTYTLDAAQAAQLTVDLDAKHTIPMHYRSQESEFGLPELSTVYDYTLRLSGVWVNSLHTIDLDENYPAKVVVLQPQNMTKKFMSIGEMEKLSTNRK
ncbi:MAG: MBL fold metallo-hydrolase [Eubacteriales bacterium]|nr:MBL fold metallo-hydrolase [Eubacteriales bacterium]